MKEHIAIVSQDPYPDLRVEREIYTLNKHGFNITFIGDTRYENCSVLGKRLDGFKCIRTNVERSAYLLLEPGLSRTVDKVKKILDKIRPDLVIAINPIAGYIAEKAEYPMIIDNHEYFYAHVKYRPLLGIPGTSISRRLVFSAGTLRRRWIYRLKHIEAHLASRHPMIFTNKYAINDFRHRFGINKDLYELRNYPTEIEMEDGDISVKRNVRIGYIGKDIPVAPPYRDLSITINLLCTLQKSRYLEAVVAGINRNYKCFKGAGWLDYSALYKLFSTIDFGLLTWTPHPLHRLKNPNKPYQYAIAGSVPVVTDTIQSVVDDFHEHALVIHSNNEKNVFRANLEKELERLLALNIEERTRLREKVKAYARKNLKWEKQESRLLDSLKNAR